MDLGPLKFCVEILKKIAFFVIYLLFLVIAVFNVFPSENTMHAIMQEIVCKDRFSVTSLIVNVFFKT